MTTIRRRPFHYVLRALAVVIVATIIWAFVGTFDWYGRGKWHNSREFMFVCFSDLMAIFLGLTTIPAAIRGWFEFRTRGQRVGTVVDVPDWTLRIQFLSLSIFLIAFAIRDILMRRA